MSGRQGARGRAACQAGFRPRGHSVHIAVLTWQIITCLLLPLGRLAEDERSSDSSAARVDDILTRLQNRSDGLSDIRCEVTLTDDDRINLAKGVKKGRVLLLMAEPNPLFLVHFEKTETEGVAGKQEWYLFDGRWLHQGIERLKQVTRQELVAEGQKIDLFDIEKAPFPLPFGHKKENILRNFDVTLLSPAAGDPPDTEHLLCNPKPESRLARRYNQLDLYVNKKFNLPTRIVVTKNNGLEIGTADFPDLSAHSINAGVTRKDFALPEAWKKYEVVVEELAPDEKPAPWGEPRGD